MTQKPLWMVGTIAMQPQNCNSHLHTVCDAWSVENWEVCPFPYKNIFNDGIVPLTPQCSYVLCNLLNTIFVESVILGMFNFLCGFVVGYSICQVTAPLSKPPTIDCKPMSNFEMASVMCFTAKFLLDSPNRSYNKWKLLGRIHDQGNLASFLQCYLLEWTGPIFGLNGVASSTRSTPPHWLEVGLRPISIRSLSAKLVQISCILVESLGLEWKSLVLYIIVSLDSL